MSASIFYNLIECAATHHVQYICTTACADGKMCAHVICRGVRCEHMWPLLDCVQRMHRNCRLPGHVHMFHYVSMFVFIALWSYHWCPYCKSIWVHVPWRKWQDISKDFVLHIHFSQDWEQMIDRKNLWTMVCFFTQYQGIQGIQGTQDACFHTWWFQGIDRFHATFDGKTCPAVAVPMAPPVEDRSLFRPRAVLEQHPKLKTWVAVAELAPWWRETKRTDFYEHPLCW